MWPIRDALKELQSLDADKSTPEKAKALLTGLKKGILVSKRHIDDVLVANAHNPEKRQELKLKLWAIVGSYWPGVAIKNIEKLIEMSEKYASADSTKKTLPPPPASLPPKPQTELPSQSKSPVQKLPSPPPPPPPPPQPSPPRDQSPQPTPAQVQPASPLKAEASAA